MPETSQALSAPKTPAFGLDYAFWLLVQSQLLALPMVIPLMLTGLALGPRYLPKPLVNAVGAIFAAIWIVRNHCARNSISVRTLAGPLDLRPRLLLTAAIAVVGLQLVATPLIDWAWTRLLFPSRGRRPRA